MRCAKRCSWRSTTEPEDGDGVFKRMVQVYVGQMQSFRAKVWGASHCEAGEKCLASLQPELEFSKKISSEATLCRKSFAKAREDSRAEADSGREDRKSLGKIKGNVMANFCHRCQVCLDASGRAFDFFLDWLSNVNQFPTIPYLFFLTNVFISGDKAK